MSQSYACNVAGAVFNWLRSNDYGRGEFICRYFRISRSTLHRKVISFRHALCNTPGHPPKDETQTSIRQLERKCSLLESENKDLIRALEEEGKRYEQNIKKLTFMLIAIGLSGRLITWILRWAFRMSANHTDILKRAQGYAEKATAIMQEHFHQHGIVTAIDEVFVEGLPVFIAVCPQSLLISNAGVYEKCSQENWTAFLMKMENLKETLSDRGHAILAAVSRRSDLGHQSDIFHCMHTVKKELLKMEKKCYGLLTKEEQARVNLEKCKGVGKDARKSAARLRRAREACATAIECFGNLEQAIYMAFAALRLSHGITLNNEKQARQTLEFVCEWIQCIHPSWKKAISALRDPNLLKYMEKVQDALKKITVKGINPLDREYALAILIYLWEEQAPRRWRGKEVIIPEKVRIDLNRCCPNWDHLCQKLFKVLESIPKASSAVECINSRVGFFRYSKKRFNNDFANLISVVHNLTPFLDGKRKGKSPAQIEKLKLPSMDIFELFELA
jgi:hypothetical protein